MPGAGFFMVGAGFAATDALWLDMMKASLNVVIYVSFKNQNRVFF